MEEKAKKIAELLRLLANEHRLLILCALRKGPLTVGELRQFTPHISARILASEKQGMNVIYRIQDQRAAALLEAIREYYCGD